MTDARPPRIPEPRRVVSAQPRKFNRRETLFRVVVVVALIASLTLAWWALTQNLVPLQKRSRELTTALSHLSAEVDTLDRKWAPADAEQIRKQYQESHSQLFADEAALTAWLNHLAEQAEPLALEVKVDFGKSNPQTSPDEKLAVIPTTVSLEVHPTPGGAESPYQRLLLLGQQLAAEGKRADLAELDVFGGPSSITRAVLVFNLWAGEDRP